MFLRASEEFAPVQLHGLNLRNFVILCLPIFRAVFTSEKVNLKCHHIYEQTKNCFLEIILNLKCV